MSSKPCTECVYYEISEDDINIIWCTESDSHIHDAYEGTCLRFKAKEKKLQDGFYE